jgi:hypothetical protein
MLMKTHQPKYSESPHKFMAREFNIRLYRLITGNKKIPQNKCYLTLANIQDNSPFSEVNQMVDSGLLYKNQVVGIDYEKNYIKRNKKNHPESTWIHGNWKTILSARDFDPALIYLDSTHFGDKLPALETLKSTLNICDHGTLVICNVMETNPRSGLGDIPVDTTVLISKLLEDNIPAKYRDWNKHRDFLTLEEIEKSEFCVPNYNYCTSKTLMRSYIFYKGKIPTELEFKNEYENFEKWCSEFERKFA